MSLRSWFVVHAADVAARLAVLEQQLQRRRIVAERQTVSARELELWCALGEVH